MRLAGSWSDTFFSFLTIAHCEMRLFKGQTTDFCGMCSLQQNISGFLGVVLVFVGTCAKIAAIEQKIANVLMHYACASG